MSGKQNKDTRRKILEGSIALFNELGVAPVSTNHIAESLGISPGNLYYHFKNKEEIIRTIFEEIRTRLDSLTDADPLNPLAIVKSYVDQVFTILLSYPFFFRDLPALVRRDQQLAKAYAELQSQFQEQLAAVFQYLSVAGVFKAFDDELSQRVLARNIWIIAIYWHSYLETSKPEQSHSIADGIWQQVFHLLKPYLSDGFVVIVANFFTQFRVDIYQSLNK